MVCRGQAKGVSYIENDRAKIDLGQTVRLDQIKIIAGIFEWVIQVGNVNHRHCRSSRRWCGMVILVRGAPR